MQTMGLNTVDMLWLAAHHRAVIALLPRCGTFYSDVIGLSAAPHVLFPAGHHIPAFLRQLNDAPGGGGGGGGGGGPVNTLMVGLSRRPVFAFRDRAGPAAMKAFQV